MLRSRQYTCLPTATAQKYLLLHLPQALHTAEQVAAPQQEAAMVATVPTLGRASSGRDKSAPIMYALFVVTMLV